MKKLWSILLCLVVVMSSAAVAASPVVDVVVVGAGPAGLSRAIEAVRLGQEWFCLKTSALGSALYTGGTVSGAGTKFNKLKV